MKRITLLSLCAALAALAQPATELWSRGYSVIPTPRDVRLDGADVAFGARWSVEAVALDPRHIAVRALLDDMQSFHGLALERGTGSPRIRLAVVPGTVKTGAEPGVDRQAYRLRVDDSLIEVTGNGDAGLFYGVQTLIQLPKRDALGRLAVPAGTIEDWPSVELRFLHWDTKHHQDRMETLKRYLDWSARLKVNMIGFELEDKFEYPSNPVIGAPGAFTVAQLQEIVDYGLERHIQVVPQIQSPAHIAYVLKHPQFAGLRADGNNYLADLCDPRSYDLIFSMYDDVIKATRGIDYFFVSTDEIYYAGIGGKCKEPYNPVNRSLKWAEFARKAHDFLAARGRRMLAWVEYPLLAEHVKLLPPDIIDGVIGEADYLPTENALGMRQLGYTSMQGDEKLFPNHLPLGTDGEAGPGRLQITFENLSNGRFRQGRPIGVYGAAWDDSGLHSETFWLGCSAVVQWGWSRGAPAPEQHATEFMRLYYGPRVTGMVEVYRMMQRQARAWEKTWDRVRSRVRGLAYADWSGLKGTGDAIRWDLTLTPPPLPSATLQFQPAFASRYAKYLAEARERKVENSRLLHALYENLALADRNRYNLEVFLSLAKFMGHHWRLLEGLAAAERSLVEAQANVQKDPKEALARLTGAYDIVTQLQKDGERAFFELTAVFEKSRFPKGQSVAGRQFVHIMDDTKDHWADRTPDLGYMMAPERSIGLDRWLNGLRKAQKGVSLICPIFPRGENGADQADPFSGGV